MDARMVFDTDGKHLGNVNTDITHQMLQLTDIASNLESFRTAEMNDDTVINLAIINSAGKKIKFPFNKTYILTQKIRIPIGTCLDLNGSKLDFSLLTNGYAIEIVPGTHDQLTIALENGYILGPNDSTNNTDGIFIGCPDDLTGDTAHETINNIIIDGFRDNLILGNQTWCNSFYNVKNIHFWRNAINFNTVINAGENIQFYGGVISNGRTGAVAVYTGQNINPDVSFHSTSFDYCDAFFNVSGGHYSLFGCHQENNTNNPMIKITFVAGNNPINFSIFGGSMAAGPQTNTSSTTPVENSNGRPWYVDLTGDKIAFTADNVDTYLYNKSSELVHVNSGSPQINIRSPHLSPKGGNPPDICEYTNQLWNGNFESSTDLQGWNLNTGTGNWTIDSSVYYSGTKSACYTVSSGTSSGSLTQDIIGLWPGKMLLFSGYFKTNLSAGNITIRLQSFNTKGDLISDWTMDSTTGCSLSDITDWARIGMGYIIPAGVVKFTFQIYAQNVTGQVWTDKMQAWVV